MNPFVSAAKDAVNAAWDAAITAAERAAASKALADKAVVEYDAAVKALEPIEARMRALTGVADDDARKVGELEAAVNVAIDNLKAIKDNQHPFIG